mmetsp:Transcript_14634/g.20690  ORF Transcript_14634/g.20690 Transcript_14634/m.20690 type:complete len:136 (-) Transcript_14634:158-565(-)
MKLSIFATLLAIGYSNALAPSASSTKNNKNNAVGRRQAMNFIMGGAAAAFVSSIPSAADALDMDAFMNAELASDTKNCDPKRDPKCAPKMTDDQALCTYGQSGKARAEACKRLKEAGGALPDAKKQKSLGGAYAM